LPASVNAVTETILLSSNLQIIDDPQTLILSFQVHARHFVQPLLAPSIFAIPKIVLTKLGAAILDLPHPPTMFSNSSCRKVYPDLNKNQQKGHFGCCM